MAVADARAQALRRRPGPNTLRWALLVSVLLHAALLAVRFAAPARFDAVFKDPPLEVILVNARSTEAPKKAQALAQANLAGGGDAASGRATSPLPPAESFRAGDSFEDLEHHIETLQEQQLQLLAQLHRQIAQFPQAEPHQPTGDPARQVQEERRRQLVRGLAEIERRIDAENARPRRRFISPATRASAAARYYDALRQKIERCGTRDFPQQGGRKLYGELIMQITVDAAGRVLRTEVVRSSGNLTLDREARAIAVAAGPFGKVSPEMVRGGFNRFVFVSRFRFTRDHTLEADINAP